MNRILLITLALGFSLLTALAQTNSLQLPAIAARPFKAHLSSQTNYQTPDWFRDAKFGIIGDMGYWQAYFEYCPISSSSQ